jgi:hypothetical protein
MDLLWHGGDLQRKKLYSAMLKTIDVVVDR